MSANPREPAIPTKPIPTFQIIASTRQPGVCRSCRTPMTWARTFPNNRAMPMTGDPIPVKEEHHERVGMVQTIPSSASHFSSCPFAKKYSKRR